MTEAESILGKKIVKVETHACGYKLTLDDGTAVFFDSCGCCDGTVMEVER